VGGKNEAALKVKAQMSKRKTITKSSKLNQILRLKVEVLTFEF
jgi:hypothetical protein